MTADSNGVGPVRDEDAVDVAVLDVWLRQRVPDLGGGPPEVGQFRGGASNLTYRLRYPARDLVLRRPPSGHKAASAHDMRREFEVQRALRPHFAAVPEVLVHCDDPAVLGAEFYVMAFVPGVILRTGRPEAERLTSADAASVGGGAFDLLAALHAVDVDAAGLRSLGRGPGYVRRQVEGWSRRYRAARTDDVPGAEAVMSWLDARQPPDAGAVLIHGDWRLDNLVLDPDDLSSVRAVLDWEMATVGDPLMDLGAALAYWVQEDDDDAFRRFRLQPSDVEGMPSRAQVLERYLQATGYVVDDWSFYEVFGLFRLAVIAQQIWYRYRLGETTNPAFARFGPAVDDLVTRCERLIGR